MFSSLRGGRLLLWTAALSIALPVGLMAQTKSGPSLRERILRELQQLAPEAHTFVVQDWRLFPNQCEVVIARAEAVSHARVGIFLACGGPPQLLELLPRWASVSVLHAAPDSVTVHETTDYGITVAFKRYVTGKPAQVITFVPPPVERILASEGKLYITARVEGAARMLVAEFSPEGTVRLVHKVPEAKRPLPGVGDSPREAPPIAALPPLPQTPVGELRTRRTDPEIVLNPKVAFQIAEGIGPRQERNGLLYFAKTFPDGEGTTGVGDIGMFDPQTRRYTFLQVPEMAPWSGASILVTDAAIWVGLKRRPEGAEYGGGLLRYDRASRQARVLAIPSIVTTLTEVAPGVTVAGTASAGAFVLEGDRVTQIQFVPQTGGGFQAVAKTFAPQAASRPGLDHVRIETELGDIDVALDIRALHTVQNFRRYVLDAAYDGTQFYRTVKMDNQPDNAVKIEVIQGGLSTSAASEAPDRRRRAPILLERTSVTGVRHLDGAISMARSAPDSATSEFFICIGDQPELDYGGRRNLDGQGFAAFGRVVKGMDVVQKIQQSPAQQQRLTPPIRIRRIRLLG
jgi:peptidyl-prolyl cis-trans isomerase A (cyclophilin A)